MLRHPEGQIDHHNMTSVEGDHRDERPSMYNLSQEQDLLGCSWSMEEKPIGTVYIP